MNKVVWPEGKRFAFTIFDDTDLTTLQNGPALYDFLENIGLRATKSVWPIEASVPSQYGGTTCADDEYKKWVLRLRDSGFEIGLHNASYSSSKRSDIIHAFDVYNEIFGEFPSLHANHTGCRDALYWGDERLSGVRQVLYNIVTRMKNHNAYFGHVPDSEYFWGDLARKHLLYVRNFVFNDINTLKACPFMPYHDPDKPYVNAWFAASEGPDVTSFNKMLDEINQDRLEEEGGLCIMYTHFGAGFVQDGVINNTFTSLMKRLASKNGWFVPVSTILNYLAGVGGVHSLTPTERNALEWKWLKWKLRRGGTS